MRPFCCVALAVLPGLGVGRAGAQSGPLPAITTHENLAPAGELRDGVLQIHLEIGRGGWRPGSERDTPLAVHAFGEMGKALEVPGPMIRVPLGTTVDATVHNGLPVAAVVHGLAGRSADAESEPLTLQPGDSREVRFPADAVGTFYYWAATSAVPINGRTRDDSQLQGALIVDSVGAAPVDRVFVISVWNEDPLARVFDGVAAINGREWPYTGRLNYRQGEVVRWRVINTSIGSHGMHLHGAYFRVSAAGDERRQRTFAESDRPLEVTHFTEPGATFESTWVPPHAGRWIFHCHMLVHMSPPAAGPARAAPAHYTQGGGARAMDDGGMGGLVLGITVAGRPNAGAADDDPRHKLQLLIRERADTRPRYQLEVRDAAQPATDVVARRAGPAAAGPAARIATKAAPRRLLGPPIVLTRGEPTEILVQNRTTQPTAIHWHGIELESYYDGVPGWGGAGSQVTPPIRPGGSFRARMTPPRAGTFIYHTHWHDAAQLTNGLYGPLIVLPPAETFDAATDKVFVFSLGEFPPFDGPLLLVNGEPQPLPVRLMPGRKYRLRLINIAPNQVALRVSLLQGGQPVRWRLLARDGADVPESQAVLQRAVQTLTVGSTYDFEIEPTGPQELALEFYLPGPKRRVTQAVVVGSLPPE